MSSPTRVLRSLGEKYLGVILPVSLIVGLVSRPFFFFLFVRFEEKVNR